MATDLKWVLTAIDNASATFRRVGDSIARTSGSASKFGKVIKWASIAATAAFAAIGVAAYKALDWMKDWTRAASDLNESINAVHVTYGKAAKGVERLSKQAATAMGLSKNDFNAAAVRFSGFVKVLAKQTKTGAVPTLKTLSQRVADFASVMNLEVPDAAEKFQSALSGEIEPLRRFGIDVSASTAEIWAQKHGLDETWLTMTAGEKVWARYGTLMAQTSKVQGDFKNTSDQLANGQRILSAKFENTKAKLGKGLLPILRTVVQWASKSLVPFINQHLVPAFQSFTDWVQRKAIPFVERLWKYLSNHQQVWKDLWQSVVDVAKAFGGFLVALTGNAAGTGDGGATGAIKKTKDPAKQLAKSISDVAQSVSDANDFLAPFIEKLSWLLDHLPKLSYLAAGPLGTLKWAVDQLNGAGGGSTGTTTGPPRDPNMGDNYGSSGPGAVGHGAHGGRGRSTAYIPPRGGWTVNNITVQGDTDPDGAAKRIEQHLYRLKRTRGSLAFQ